MKNSKPKICGIVTKVFGIKAFMLDNLKFAATEGLFDSYFICEKSDEFTNTDIENLTYIPVDIKRGNVSPKELLRSIYAMYKLFRKNRFDIIQYASSNAALYASIAGWLARVPVRIYCQWGISYTDYSGLKKLFYKTMVKVTCLFSTHVQPDSFANLEFAIAEGLYPRKKGSVISKGSANGVDMKKFDISYKAEWRKKIRSEYEIPEQAKVFGFVGRLVPEKGVNELLEAFMNIPDKNLRFLVVGPNYEIERLDQELWHRAHKDKRIIFCGQQGNTAPFYAAMDFLVLPSYREGFGSVVLESAALGVPSICSDIKGPTDFVKDNVNGLICMPMSSSSLNAQMVKAISLLPEEYKRLSDTAYTMVKADFDAEVFRPRFLANRLSMLNENS